MIRLRNAPKARDISALIISHSSFLQDWQVLLPRADRGGVLPAHHAQNLRDVTEVVRDPRRQQLAERDAAEFGMPTAKAQPLRRDLQLGERRKARFAQAGEFINQLIERFALRLFKLCEAVE